MIIANLLLSTFLFSGFNYIGTKLVKYFKLNIFFSKIVNLNLFNIILGIVFSLLISYPLLLYKVISSSYLIILITSSKLRYMINNPCNISNLLMI